MNIHIARRKKGGKSYNIRNESMMNKKPKVLASFLFLLLFLHTSTYYSSPLLQSSYCLCI